jgi:hypothetical protein
MKSSPYTVQTREELRGRGQRTGESRWRRSRGITSREGVGGVVSVAGEEVSPPALICAGRPCAYISSGISELQGKIEHEGCMPLVENRHNIPGH